MHSDSAKAAQFVGCRHMMLPAIWGWKDFHWVRSFWGTEITWNKTANYAICGKERGVLGWGSMYDDSFLNRQTEIQADRQVR